MAIWKWRGTIPFGFNTAGGMDCMQFGRSTHFRCPRHVSIPQAVWIACNNAGEGGYVPSTEVSIPQAVWIACNYYEKGICIVPMLSFQYRKRYGLHAMMDRWLQRRDSLGFNTASGMDCMQFYAAISKAFYAVQFQYRKRYGLHAILPTVWSSCLGLHRFNTASGMDCMQYRPSQPLGQLNPEAGFLNGSLFLANRRNLAGFFCRQNRLKTSANPVISRKLLSTGKI